MTRFSTSAAILSGSLFVAGCVAPVADAPRRVQQAPPSYSLIGLETVMGHNSRYLEGEFGEPDLDIREGPARKLQFSGPACVLDAYLYPTERGADPIVTHVDARLPDGRDMDRASCVAALHKEHEGH
jgi:hypothetical protein